MKIVFFGNTEYSTIVEKALHEKFGLSLVVTIPDRPNRKNQLIPNPVKQFATRNNISVITTEKLDKLTIKKIKAHLPDFLVVADYGLILPKELLGLPKYAPLNVHHSLLPKYRGPSPAPTAILNGDKISGVTIIKMTERVDAGDILAQEEYELKDDETTDSLLIKLNTLGGKIIIPIIERYINGTAKAKKQDESKATLTPRLNKNNGYVELENPPSPVTLDRMTRAYFPWPGVWTLLRLKASEGQAKDLRIKFLPGKKIQVEGKKAMSYKDFVNGYPKARAILDKLNLA